MSVTGLAFLGMVLNCHITDAHYKFRSSSEVSAEFVDIGDTSINENDGKTIALRMDFSRTGHQFWWIASDGGNTTPENMTPIEHKSKDDSSLQETHELGNISKFGSHGNISTPFIGFDSNYNVIDIVPLKNDTQAPAHFIMPYLGSVIWNGSQKPFGFGSAEDRIGIQMFDLVSCDRHR